MNHKDTENFFHSDPRVSKLLREGSHVFVDETGEKKEWIIKGVAGFGGSGIAYFACLPQFPAKIFILKEYFPYSLRDCISRDGSSLKIEPNKKSQWDQGLEHFLNELQVQKKLPDSTNPEGSRFIYATNQFRANGTAYIVSDANGSITLSKKIRTIHAELKDRKKEQIENSHLKFVLSCGIEACKALQSLHRIGFLHLDISDTNILIDQNDRARLNDLASALPIGADFKKLQTTCTPFFSPIEQYALMEGDNTSVLSEKTDTYALCSVLYKCIFNRNYDPLFNELDEKKTKLPLCPNLSQESKELLLSILKKGLSGIDYRYTPEKLEKALFRVLKMVQKEEKNNTILNVALATGGLLLSLLGLFVLVRLFNIPRPVVSAEIDSIYSKGEDVVFDLVVDAKDRTPSFVDEQKILKKIKLNNFDCEEKELSFVSKSGTQMTYRVRFNNIKAASEGEKSISIGEIYCTVYEVWNKPFALSFYYAENISCEISEPNVTKVNADAGHSIQYTVIFNSPVEFSIDISTVKVVNFTSEHAQSEYLGNNTFILTFENIHGEICDSAYFVINEASAVSQDGIRYCKDTPSPSFSIVEDEISNTEIHCLYSVFEKDIQPGGIVVLKPSIMNAQRYLNRITPSDISLEGFDADIYINDEDIVLSNLQIPSGSGELWIAIAPGCILSENGSVSKEMRVMINRDIPDDKTVPTLALLRLGGEVFLPGTTAIYKLSLADETGYVMMQENPEQFITTVGFEGEIWVRRFNNVCYISIANILPDGSGEKPHILIKEGFAFDTAGNQSYQLASQSFQFK